MAKKKRLAKKVTKAKSKTKKKVVRANKSNSPVTKLAFALVYADDFERSVEFYKRHFGFKEEFKMSEKEVYGNMGTVGLWIGGGYQNTGIHEKSARATAMMGVKDASKLFIQLKESGVKLVQEAPITMQQNRHWFQFADPDGNVWDVLD